MTSVECKENNYRLYQGDIIKDVPYIESYSEVDGQITISIITFPYAIIVSQECDLEWDQEKRPDKFDLISALLVPLYNYEHVLDGSYLKHLGTQMGSFSPNKSKTDNKMLRQNENPRYHYIEFPDDIEIVPSVCDFKQYFSVSISSLLELKRGSNYICTLKTPYKERLVQRYTNYLSRIGLPVKEE